MQNMQRDEVYAPFLDFDPATREFYPQIEVIDTVQTRKCVPCTREALAVKQILAGENDVISVPSVETAHTVILISSWIHRGAGVPDTTADPEPQVTKTIYTCTQCGAISVTGK